MRRRPHAAFIFLAAFVLLVGSATPLSAATPATPYTIYDLGVIGEYGSSDAAAVNEHQNVVGTSGGRVFLYDAGSIRDLGFVGSATAINALGTIVGATESDPYSSRAFIYENNTLRGLGTLGGNRSMATGINVFGVVVGYSSTAAGIPHAFIYENGALRDLGTLGGEYSSASGINDHGHVVGWAYTAQTTKRAFVYRNGEMINLGTLAGSSAATAVNDNGHVVGWAMASDYNNHAVLFRDGKVTDLGTLGGLESTALNINNAEQIVGASDTASGARHAFIYDAEVGMRDLNSLLPYNPEWELLQANDINDGGQIVGTGLINGQQHAFLMTPTRDSFDWTAPTTGIAVSPAPNAAGWHTDRVIVGLRPVDNVGGAGVRSSSYTVDHSYQREGTVFVVEGEAEHPVIYWSVDHAGNGENPQTAVIKIDTTPPMITGLPTTKPNINNWYNSPVTVHFECVDAISGVAVCPADKTVTTEGMDQRVSGVTVDVAGRQSTVEVSGINIDMTPPQVTIHGVVNNGVYVLGATKPSCSATDTPGGSGIAPDAVCTGRISGGLANGVGTLTYTATATDRAGNTTTQQVSYRVVYQWGGFQQPVNSDGTSVFKAGTPVPVRFQLKRADGSVVQANTAPRWVLPSQNGTTAAAINEAVSKDVLTSGSSYLWKNQQYEYVWGSSRSQSRSVYRIGVILDDGQTYYINVGVR